MTVTNQEQPVGTRITVLDQTGPLSFCGELLAEVSWTYDTAYRRGHTRWTDIALYRVLDESNQYEYVVQVLGRSVVYHRADGPCGRGVRVTVGSIRNNDPDRYEALAACHICNPADLDDLGDGDRVSEEGDIPTLYKCRDAMEVVQCVSERGRGSMNPSSPNMRLLQAAYMKDRDIAEAVGSLRSL